MGGNQDQKSVPVEAGSFSSRYLGRRRRRRRFQFSLLALLVFTGVCCVVLKLMQVFAPESVLAGVAGGSVGLWRGWRRGTLWTALIGTGVSLGMLHVHMLHIFIPGWEGGWSWLDAPFHCFLAGLVGSLLGAAVQTSSADRDGGPHARDAAQNTSWWPWTFGPWGLAVGAAIGCAAVPSWGWGIYTPGGEIRLALSGAVYVACLTRSGIVFGELNSNCRPHALAVYVAATVFGLLYLWMFFEVMSSVYWQNSSAHYQDHWGSIFIVLGSAGVFEAALLMKEVALWLLQSRDGSHDRRRDNAGGSGLD